jgi:hypothetical protein
VQYGEDASRLSNLSRESEGQSLGSIHTGVSGETGSLPSSLVAYNDWEIAPMDIEIMRREDGSPWELGAGAFGKVRGGAFFLSLSFSFSSPFFAFFLSPPVCRENHLIEY